MSNPGVVCDCYDPPSMDVIAGKVREAKTCKFELDQYKGLATTIEAKPWYTDPSWVIGGMVIGVGMGGVLGYLLSNHK